MNLCLVFVGVSHELIEVHWIVVGILDRQQSLEWFALVTLRMVVLVEVMQVPMNIDLATVCQAGRRLVGKPAVAILHTIAGERKALIHPPVGPVLPIMITSDKDLASGKLSENIDHLAPVAYGYIAEMDYQISWFDYFLPAFDKQLGEVSRPHAVSRDPIVIKMGICC